MIYFIFITTKTYQILRSGYLVTEGKQALKTILVLNCQIETFEISTRAVIVGLQVYMYINCLFLCKMLISNGRSRRELYLKGSSSS